MQDRNAYRRNCVEAVLAYCEVLFVRLERLRKSTKADISACLRAAIWTQVFSNTEYDTRLQHLLEVINLSPREKHSWYPLDKLLEQICVSHRGFSVIRKLWSRIMSPLTCFSSRALKWIMTLVFESLYPLFAGACIAVSIRPVPHPIRPLFSYGIPFILDARDQVYSSWKLPVWLGLPPSHVSERTNTSRRNDAFFERVKEQPAEGWLQLRLHAEGHVSHKWNVIVGVTD
jgi:hypothetical protein